MQRRGAQRAVCFYSAENQDPENQRRQGQLYLPANRAGSSAAAFTVRQGS